MRNIWITSSLENWVWSLGQEDPQRREWLPTPVFLPGEFHGQRSLANRSPWGCKELGMTEQLKNNNINHPSLLSRLVVCLLFQWHKKPYVTRWQSQLAIWWTQHLGSGKSIPFLGTSRAPSCRQGIKCPESRRLGMMTPNREESFPLLDSQAVDSSKGETAPYNGHHLSLDSCKTAAPPQCLFTN